MLKILILSSYRFWPPEDGGQQRIWHLTQNISEEFEVISLALDWGSDIADVKKGNKQFKSVTPDYEYWEQAQLLANKYGNVGFDMAAMLYGPIIIRKCLPVNYTPHIVVVERIWMHTSTTIFPRSKILLNCHDIETKLFESVFRGRSIKKFIKLYEDFVFKNVDFATACTKEDSDLIAKAGCRNVRTLPNGFSQILNRNKRDFTKLSKAQYVFVGSGHLPNQEAVEKLIAVSCKIPEIEINIIGNVCNYFSKRQLPKNIKLHGFVDETSLSSILSSSVAFLNPVSNGSGSSLKVALAASEGLPIIGTRFGIRGYEELYENDFFEANTVEEFVKQIDFISRNLNPNIEQRLKLSKASKEFTWSKIGNTYSNLIDEISKIELLENRYPKEILEFFKESDISQPQKSKFTYEILLKIYRTHLKKRSKHIHKFLVWIYLKLLPWIIKSRIMIRKITRFSKDEYVIDAHRELQKFKQLIQAIKDGPFE